MDNRLFWIVLCIVTALMSRPICIADEGDSDMAIGVKITVSRSGDVGVIEGLTKRLQNTKPLMQNVGVYGVNKAKERLEFALRQDPGSIRTGRLAASLTLFDVTNDLVAWGSNVVYAAQVHHGGTILPRDAKALAIPLPDTLKRSGESPRDIDPDRSVLKFVPYTGSKPNIFGLLVDPEQELTGRQRIPRGRTRHGPGPLFALAHWVNQDPRPYLMFNDEDRRAILEDIVPVHLGLR